MKRLVGKKFSKGSVVVEELPSGNAHVTLSHESYVYNRAGGLVVERADVQDLADCLTCFAKSTDKSVFCAIVGVTAEWVEA